MRTIPGCVILWRFSFVQSDLHVYNKKHWYTVYTYFRSSSNFTGNLLCKTYANDTFHIYVIRVYLNTDLRAVLDNIDNTYRKARCLFMIKANEHYGGSAAIRCDSSVLTYKRDASPSSVEKTSSDESYFTDPEFLPQQVLPLPSSAPPPSVAAAAAAYPAPSTIAGLYRQGSTSTVVRASFSSGAVAAAGCGPPSAMMTTRRTSSLASVYRSAHDHQYSSAVADKSSATSMCILYILILTWLITLNCITLLSTAGLYVTLFSMAIGPVYSNHFKLSWLSTRTLQQKPS